LDPIFPNISYYRTVDHFKDSAGCWFGNVTLYDPCNYFSQLPQYGKGKSIWIHLTGNYCSPITWIRCWRNYNRILGWHWIFFITVPFGLTALVLAYLFLPDNSVIEDYHGFDLVGSLLIFFAMIALIISLELGGRMSWTSPSIVLGLAVSLLLLIIFYKWENKHPHPLFKMCLLKQRYLNLSIVAGS
jgi:MFS family permease